MTDARPPGEQPDDPLLREMARHWEDIESRADGGQRDRMRALAAEMDGPDSAEARAALTDQLIDLLPPDHPLIRLLRTGAMFVKPGTVRESTRPLTSRRAESGPATGTIPVTIYLSDERIHQQVEEAIADLLASAGLQILSRDDPVAGSWFRRMVAVEAATTAAHLGDARLWLAPDAQRTAVLMQGLSPVLAALQPTKDAVIRVGTLLILKVDWTVNVIQLTAAQQLKLDHSPQLVSDPREIAKILNIIRPEDPGDRHAYQLSPPPECG